jgi:hypothetical protein
MGECIAVCGGQVSPENRSERVHYKRVYRHAGVEHLVAKRNLVLLRRQKVEDLIDDANQRIETTAKAVLSELRPPIGLVRSRMKAIAKVAKLPFDLITPGVQFSDALRGKVSSHRRVPRG